MCQFEILLYFVALLANVAVMGDLSGEDIYQKFLNLLANPNVKQCEDRTLLLPDCKVCIPGLTREKLGTSCTKFTESSTAIRDEIKQLTVDRYKDKIQPNRPYGLYPYLEFPDFLQRQEKFGAWLTADKVNHIVDIGAYYNPVYMFLDLQKHCPKSFVVIEPILDPFSGYVPCAAGIGGENTHIAVLPITFKNYATLKSFLHREQHIPEPDAVVCIGCDSHYGPNRRLLETTFSRPFTLYLEYPSEYIHNSAYKKMGMARGLGENMTFANNYEVPPLKSASGHRAEDWDLEKPLFTGFLKISQADRKLYLRIYSIKGSYSSSPDDSHLIFFAECPIEIQPNEPITRFVDAVIDSSRYFVLKIKDRKSGKSATIGIGFEDRDPAFELKNCLNEYIRYVNRMDVANNVAKELESDGQEFNFSADHIDNECSDDDTEKEHQTTISCHGHSHGTILALPPGEKMKIGTLAGRSFKNKKHPPSSSSPVPTRRLSIPLLPPPTTSANTPHTGTTIVSGPDATGMHTSDNVGTSNEDEDWGDFEAATIS